MTQQQTAQITFMRHGEKNDGGALTVTGFEQARRAGIATSHLSDSDVLLFHSGVSRVKDTVRTMAANLHLSSEAESAYTLGEHIVDYVAPNLHYLVDPDQKGEYFAHWDDIELTDENIYRRMVAFLSVDDPDAGYGYNAKQMAQNIAQMIGIQVRFANMTDIQHKVQCVNGTHEPVIMAFLYYFLNDFSPHDPARFLNDLGGSIDYTESFHVNVWHRSRHEFAVELVFRNKRYPVDLERLRAFAYMR